MRINVTRSGKKRRLRDWVLKPIYYVYRKKLFREVNEGKVPEHVAIIMDGNRRFAIENEFDQVVKGHEYGVEKLEDVLEWCSDLGIRNLTAYAFSTENFNRDEEEIQKLMELFEKNFRNVAHNEKIHENKVKVRALGEVSKLPERVKDAVEVAEESTKNYNDYTLNIAVAYGGRREIADAVEDMIDDYEDGVISREQIDENKIKEYLYIPNMPDPDLVIRTGGEIRLSNFLLYQSAYSELYFTDVYFPNIRKIDFLRIIREYQERERRFGR